MRLQRNGEKRTSERNIALVRIQIEAQTRNRRWYDFLCAVRDDLQARLRQQGYSRGSQADRHFDANANRANALDALSEATGPSPEVSGRLRATMGSGSLVPPADIEAARVPEVDAADPGAHIWWEEQDRSPL